MLQLVQRVVTRHLLAGAGLRIEEGHGGAITLIQRFGSAANLNSHLHCLVLDGVYHCDTDDALQALLQTISVRLMKILTRRGALVEGMGQSYLADRRLGSLINTVRQQAATPQKARSNRSKASLPLPAEDRFGLRLRYLV